jgi:hypothetical protein
MQLGNYLGELFQPFLVLLLPKLYLHIYDHSDIEIMGQYSDFLLGGLPL